MFFCKRKPIQQRCAALPVGLMRRETVFGCAPVGHEIRPLCHRRIGRIGQISRIGRGLIGAARDGVWWGERRYWGMAGDGSWLCACRAGEQTIDSPEETDGNGQQQTVTDAAFWSGEKTPSRIYNRHFCAGGVQRGTPRPGSTGGTVAMGESRGGRPAPSGGAATSRHYMPFLCLLSFPAEKKVGRRHYLPFLCLLSFPAEKKVGSPQVLYSISSPMAAMARSRFWRVSAAFSSVPGLFS